MASPPVDPSVARLSSPWGPRKLQGRDDLHTGLDFSTAEGTPVHAVADGVVQLVDWVSGYGQTVVLKHEGTLVDGVTLWSLYGHLQPGSTRVVRGELVSEGDRLASVGRSAGTREQPAEVRSPHLHNELLTRWPPRGKDLDRVDPTGLVWAPFVGPSASTPTKVAAGGGGILILGLALWLARRANKKAPRGRTTSRRESRSVHLQHAARP